ncbi:CZB domain-containing protein [Bacterioplanoides sp.]|uniref:CZB domain-containing protein n=1 Tax=Bacterioplanoides sp. TaxID=2066072 RepID=UPI003B00D3D7
MEFLSFRHGQQHYAVPIASVRFITADNSLKLTRVALGDGQQHDMVEFDGKACVVLSLADLLGQDSAQTEVQALVELLHAREQDHVNWLDALEESLTQGSEFTKARDPNECAFGRWYKHFHTDNEALAQLLEKFDIPHQRIHALAHELLTMRDAGETDAALAILTEHKRTTLTRLQALFSDARNMVSSSVRPTVIMIQDDKSQVIGLKVDDIGEVFSCSPEQQDSGSDELLPHFAHAWLKAVELDGEPVTVMQLNPNLLLLNQDELQDQLPQPQSATQAVAG